MFSENKEVLLHFLLLFLIYDVQRHQNNEKCLSRRYYDFPNLPKYYNM